MSEFLPDFPSCAINAGHRPKYLLVAFSLLIAASLPVGYAQYGYNNLPSPMQNGMNAAGYPGPTYGTQTYGGYGTSTYGSYGGGNNRNFSYNSYGSSTMNSAPYGANSQRRMFTRHQTNPANPYNPGYNTYNQNQQQGYNPNQGQGYNYQIPNGLGQPRQNQPYPQQQQRPVYQQQPSTQNYTPPAAKQQDNSPETSNLEEYARQSEAGNRLFNSGELTEAIEAFSKAERVAPDASLPVVYNNLAVVLIKRGNYYHGKKQEENALNDFRKALYYLDAAWPEGADRKPLHTQNLKVARENLQIAYRNLGISATDHNKHLDIARKLRLTGKFPEAITEYNVVLERDKRNPTAIRALGDLFTVMNLPDKSKKYYALAADIPEASVATPVGTAISGLTNGKDDLLVQLGNAQFKTGELDKAIDSFNQALAINPANDGALNMLEKIWQDELKINPNSVTAHANLGSIYQKKRQFDKALQQYNAAEHFADNDPKTAFEVKKQIRLNMGTLFQAQKRYDLALKAYDTVLQVDPNQQTANFYKATLLEDTGNTAGAIQAYNKLIAIDPKNTAAQNKLLGLVRSQNDPSKVIAGLKDYADRFKGNATIQAQIAEDLHQRKAYDDAVTYYNRALQIDPKMAGVWANLGALYNAQGKDELSMEAFAKAQTLEPANTTFKNLAKNAQSDRGQKLYEQAVALQSQNKSADALDLFRRSLAIEDRSDTRYDYAIALQTSGKLDDAIAEYKKVLIAEPKNAEAAYAMGTAYQDKKDMANAETAYKTALRLKPGYADAQKAITEIQGNQAAAELNAGIDAYNNKQYDSALIKVNQALAKTPQDTMGHYYKGLILDAQKKTTLAIQSYQAATKANPNFADAYYALGIALDTNKNPTAAKTAFQKFIQLSAAAGTDDDFVKYAKERVK